MTLSQIIPFNENRFDACMVYLAQKHSRNLTQYEMVKLHVMADVYHTITYGQPMIGGSLEAWTNGPVVKKAYNRVAVWGHRFDETGEQSPMFNLVEQLGNANHFKPSVEADPDDFSVSEVEALEKAWDTVMSMEFRASQDYFHKPISFIGKAWHNAKLQSRAIDWNDIIDAYDTENGTDHTTLKTLIHF